MNNTTRDRAILPLAIPLGSIAFIFVVAFGMSRVLLNVQPEIATAVALMAAFNILVACAFFALRSGFTARDLVPMAGVVALPIILGAAVAAGVIPVEGGGEHEGGGAETAVVSISANNLQFSTDRLEVPANQAFELKFENREAAPHNIWITGDGDATIFKEPFFAGPKTVTWDVPAIAPGEYPFKCEVHPTMKGTVVATESAEEKTEGEGGEHTAGAAAVEIAANNLKFSTASLEVPADAPFKLTFDNKEAQPHNVEILTAKGGEKLFTEKFFSGPKKVTWDVPAMKAGSYYFQCQVHPNMSGTVTAS